MGDRAEGLQKETRGLPGLCAPRCSTPGLPFPLPGEVWKQAASKAGAVGISVSTAHDSCGCRRPPVRTTERRRRACRLGGKAWGGEGGDQTPRLMDSPPTVGLQALRGGSLGGGPPRRLPSTPGTRALRLWAEVGEHRGGGGGFAPAPPPRPPGPSSPLCSGQRCRPGRLPGGQSERFIFRRMETGWSALPALPAHQPHALPPPSSLALMFGFSGAKRQARGFRAAYVPSPTPGRPVAHPCAGATEGLAHGGGWGICSRDSRLPRLPACLPAGASPHSARRGREGRGGEAGRQAHKPSAPC